MLVKLLMECNLSMASEMYGTSALIKRSVSGIQLFFFSRFDTTRAKLMTLLVFSTQNKLESVVTILISENPWEVVVPSKETSWIAHPLRSLKGQGQSGQVVERRRRQEEGSRSCMRNPREGWTFLCLSRDFRHLINEQSCSKRTIIS